jgi:hypothetical protein
MLIWVDSSVETTTIIEQQESPVFRFGKETGHLFVLITLFMIKPFCNQLLHQLFFFLYIIDMQSKI